MLQLRMRNHTLLLSCTPRHMCIIPSISRPSSSSSSVLSTVSSATQDKFHREGVSQWDRVLSPIPSNLRARLKIMLVYQLSNVSSVWLLGQNSVPGNVTTYFTTTMVCYSTLWRLEFYQDQYGTWK